MTDATMNEIRHGQRQLTPKLVDDVLTEAKATVLASPSELAGLGRLFDFVAAQQANAMREVLHGRRPMTAEVLDKVLADARAAILDAPSDLAAVAAFHDFGTAQLKTIVEHRDLTAAVRGRIAAAAKLGQQLTERDATLEELGMAPAKAGA